MVAASLANVGDGPLGRLLPCVPPSRLELARPGPVDEIIPAQRVPIGSQSILTQNQFGLESILRTMFKWLRLGGKKMPKNFEGAMKTGSSRASKRAPT